MIGSFVGLVRDDGSRLDFDFPSKYREFIKAMAGEEVEIEIRKKRTKRTLKQNAYLHAAIKPFADYCGYTVEEMKLALLGECFGFHQVGGVTLPVKLHTSDLSTQEFVEITELMIQRAAEQNVLILYPDEFKAAKRKQLRRGAGDDTSRLPAVHGGDRSLDRAGVLPAAAPGVR